MWKGSCTTVISEIYLDKRGNKIQINSAASQKKKKRKTQRCQTNLLGDVSMEKSFNM